MNPNRMWSNPLTRQRYSPRILRVFLFLILLACGRKENAPPPPAAPPDFARNVALVLYAPCAPCHRPRSAAPVSLLTYGEVRKELKTIRQLLQHGLMPPWPADTTYSRFRDEMIITAAEKDLLPRWIDAGAPPGDTTQLPAP